MIRKITFKANPLTLMGRALKEGSSAPDFKVTAQDLKEVTLSEFVGKVKIINSFPSLDTPVCDLQVKEFNKQALGVSSDVVVIGISMDLPFAQKRFCAANDITNEVVLSDYKSSSFGINYGLLIKELRLLARAALILDTNDILRYLQVADELTRPLDYADVLAGLQEIIKNPGQAIKQDLLLKCKPCEGGIVALPKDKVEKLLAFSRLWQLVDDKKLIKEFSFKDFLEAKYFLDLIAVIAEEQGHHPNFSLVYNKLKITLTTHAAGGLTENDFIMARVIDELDAKG